MPKCERAAIGPSVIGSGRTILACPICGKLLTGHQRIARFDRYRAALSRQRKIEGQAERDRRIRELLEAAVRVLGVDHTTPGTGASADG